MPSRRPNPLTVQLSLASIVSVLALSVVCGVGVLSLRQLSVTSSVALRGQMHLFQEATAFQALLFQKGFDSAYMLTRDPMWMTELERSRRSFGRWLDKAQSSETDPDARQLLTRIVAEYTTYDEGRERLLASFRAGETAAASAQLPPLHAHVRRLLQLCQEFSQFGQLRAQRELALEQRAMEQRTWLLFFASFAGTAASLAMGFLLARRIGKPIYELQLQVESAVQKTRLSVSNGPIGIAQLGEHMAMLVHKMDETDAAIREQRQRLIQSEKMSVIGEVTAKLAHEILNPLAGMKAAAQLLLRARSQDTMPTAEVRETAQALDHEITRVDQLVRRLVNYARPLAPRTQPCTVRSIVDPAVDAARPELTRAGAVFVRAEEEELPPLEVDALLIGQVLINLLTNAAQAGPPGGRIVLSTRRVSHLGREHVSFEVVDEGPGITPEHLPRLFHPFFTTKAKGHGLGLAISQNIAMEHGGQITARSRTDRSGAVFELLLPLSR